MASVSRAIAVVKEMLTDRGIGLGELAAVGDREIEALATSVEFFYLSAEDRDVVVVTRALKTQDLQKAAATLDEERRKRAIVVVKDRPVLFHRKCVESSYGPLAEIFHLAELQYNVSRHELVPAHVRLEDAQVKAVLKTYMLNDKRSLPTLLSTDPVAKYMGLRAGDVVEITRPSPTAGDTKFWRHCVADKA